VMDDFKCPDCGSRALVYPKVLEDEGPVTCSSCGTFVLTYSELKRRSELALASKRQRVPLSGC
jgi:transcription elongation factor Elf1